MLHSVFIVFGGWAALVLLGGLLLVAGVAWIAVRASESPSLDPLPASALGLGKTPDEIDRPRETGVVHRVQLSTCAFEVVEEVRFLGPIPRIKRARFVRVLGEVRSRRDALEVSRAVAESVGELDD